MIVSDRFFITLFIGAAVALVIFIFYSISYRSAYDAKCEAAGGVPTHARDQGARCWDPKAFIEVRP